MPYNISAKFNTIAPYTDQLQHYNTNANTNDEDDDDMYHDNTFDRMMLIIRKIMQSISSLPSFFIMRIGITIIISISSSSNQYYYYSTDT